MNRMHPEDLRALVAATLWAGARADETNRGAFGWAKAAECADNLLAEMKRTTKAEPEPKFILCPACHATAREGETLTHGQRCPVAPGAWDLPRTCSHVDETTPPDPPYTIISSRDHTKRMTVPKWLFEECIAIKAQGAREERERIIAMLDKDEPGYVLLQIQEALPPKRLRGWDLRVALEPGP
ncbi:hypothetical protein [Geothrix campi]|uniref:hypothetical protein n=1 Tax=Geothrix campi TaxID=2966450 RepID=UPI00214823B4|nr:hypothetical protein [Geothrix sp. SG10]